MDICLIHPRGAVHFGSSRFSFAFQDGRISYFSNREPFDFDGADDRGAMLLRTAKLAESGVRRTDLQAAFGIGRSTLKQAVNKLRDKGEASLHEPCRGRGPSVIVGDHLAEKADRLRASGMSGAADARELGVAPETLNYNRRKGFIASGPPFAGKSEAQSEPEAAKPDVGAPPPRTGESAEDSPDCGARDRRDRLG